MPTSLLHKQHWALSVAATQPPEAVRVHHTCTTCAPVGLLYAYATCPSPAAGILTDAQFIDATKSLVDSTQVDPLSSGGYGAQHAAESLGGAEHFERYGVNGIPHAQPSPDDTASAAHLCCSPTAALASDSLAS